MKPLIASLFCASAFCALLSPRETSAAAIWTNATDGLWRIPSNWAGGLVPSGISSGTTYLTNGGSKVVTIDNLTAPANLILNRMDVSGPGNATNMLFLQDVGTNNPLIIANNRLNFYRGSALRLTNSSLVLTGRISEFNVWMGSVTLESGIVRVREEPPTQDVTVRVRIGRTNAATLTILDGLFETSALQIGESPGSQFGISRGAVALKGGELKVHGELSIGDSASCTGRVEVTGGQLTVINNQTNITRVGDHGTGTLIVSNAMATLNNVSIARHDAAIGFLRIDANGVARCVDDVSIGRFPGSSGLIVINGGRLTATNDTIWVGREGQGQLVISNGLVEVKNMNVTTVPTNTASGLLQLYDGAILVSSNFDIGDPQLATGQAVIHDGNFTVTNRSQTAHVTIPRGTLTFNGGTLTTDFLYLTNNSGQMAFNSGILRTRGTIVSNNAPFVVGNGIKPAVLELLGGTHVFAQGLVISSNATLIGCGTIVGSVINHGTIATNCASVALAITSQPQSLTVTNGAQATFSVTATGSAPLGYQWSFNETPIPGAVSSTLVLPSVTSSMAGAYTVAVSDSSGSVVSNPAQLRILTMPQISNVSFANGTATISFTSISGLTYVLEYKDRLDDAGWTQLSSTPGSGGLLQLTDPSAMLPTRFYRVRVE